MCGPACQTSTSACLPACLPGLPGLPAWAAWAACLARPLTNTHYVPPARHTLHCTNTNINNRHGCAERHRVPRGLGHVLPVREAVAADVRRGHFLIRRPYHGVAQSLQSYELASKSCCALAVRWLVVVFPDGRMRQHVPVMEGGPTVAVAAVVVVSWWWWW
jgi:hypothetical protein